MILRVKVFAFTIGLLALGTLIADVLHADDSQTQSPQQRQQTIQQRLDTNLIDQYNCDIDSWKKLLDADPKNEYYKFKLEQAEKRRWAIEEKNFPQ